jgi:peptidoglycan/xylan/chitin deacetylase (PgdA/CDA1 family)
MNIRLDSGSMLTQVAVAAGLVVGGCAYAARWPTSQIFGRTLIAGPDPNEIALTFDDGPNGSYTERLLDLLAAHKVKATFFMVGNYVLHNPALARTVAEAGHLLGNHTMTHPHLFWQAGERVREELKSTTAMIEGATGQPVKYFRPPFGSRRPEVLRIVRELGLTPVMWNITAHDWDATASEPLAAKIQRGIRRNQTLKRASNLLLHDGGHRQVGTDRSITLAATKALLETNPNLRYVRVDAWA